MVDNLSEEQAALLLRLADAYENRNARGEREEFVFVTAGGGAGTSMIHRGLHNPRTG